MRSALRVHVSQCVVDSLVDYWMTTNDHGSQAVTSLPPSPVVHRALTLLGDAVEASLVEEFVAAELPPSPDGRWVRPTAEEIAAYVTRRDLHDQRWEVPSGVDLRTHALVEERLRSEQSRVENLGVRLPIDFLLTLARWWPGRVDSRDPLGTYALFRASEEREGADVLVAAIREAARVVRGEGLPPFDPAEWIIASTDYRIRHQGRL